MSEKIKCQDCKKEMSLGSGCVVDHIKKSNGDVVFRIPHRDEKPCHDCNVIKGQYHHFECDWERCPICGSQLLTCGCFI